MGGRGATWRGLMRNSNTILVTAAVVIKDVLCLKAIKVTNINRQTRVRRMGRTKAGV